jgi:hypothetical protein
MLSLAVRVSRLDICSSSLLMLAATSCGWFTAHHQPSHCRIAGTTPDSPKQLPSLSEGATRWFRPSGPSIPVLAALLISLPS